MKPWKDSCGAVPSFLAIKGVEMLRNILRAGLPPTFTINQVIQSFTNYLPHYLSPCTQHPLSLSSPLQDPPFFRPLPYLPLATLSSTSRYDSIIHSTEPVKWISHTPAVDPRHHRRVATKSRCWSLDAREGSCASVSDTFKLTTVQDVTPLIHHFFSPDPTIPTTEVSLQGKWKNFVFTLSLLLLRSLWKLLLIYRKQLEFLLIQGRKLITAPYFFVHHSDDKKDEKKKKKKKPRKVTTRCVHLWTHHEIRSQIATTLKGSCGWWTLHSWERVRDLLLTREDEPTNLVSPRDKDADAPVSLQRQIERW
jgi:hypothetical protein